MTLGKELLKLFALTTLISYTHSKEFVQNGKCAVDIAFLIDTSNSLYAQYFKQKVFVIQLATKLGISEHGTRGTVITFSAGTLSRVAIKLNEFYDIIKFNNAVNMLSEVYGYWTKIGLGLKLANQSLFNEEDGARSNVRKVLLILSDGKQNPKITGEPKATADLLRQRGVEMFALLVGTNRSKETMQDITQNHEHIFDYESYDAALQTDNSEGVFRKICPRPCNVNELEECDKESTVTTPSVPTTSLKTLIPVKTNILPGKKETTKVDVVTGEKEEIKIITDITMEGISPVGVSTPRPNEVSQIPALNERIDKSTPMTLIVKVNGKTILPKMSIKTPTKQPMVSSAAPSDAPVISTDAPLELTDVLVLPTVAPEEPSDVPVIETAAPKELTDEPSIPTIAPKEPSDVPVIATAAPKESTDEPSIPTIAPEEPSDVPVIATAAPKESTDEPSIPTIAPEEPSNVPVIATAAPKESIDGPLTPTAEPEAPSDAAEVPSDVPEVTSDAPEVPSDAPEVPSDAPVISTTTPKESIDTPEESSSIPEVSTVAPKESTDEPLILSEVPSDTPMIPTAAPEEPSDVPEKPSIAPVISTGGPKESTDAPAIPTTAPEKPSYAPDEPSDAPTISSAAPRELTDAPVIPSASPEEPSDAPVISTSPPQELIDATVIPTALPEKLTDTPEAVPEKVTDALEVPTVKPEKVSHASEIPTPAAEKLTDVPEIPTAAPEARTALPKIPATIRESTPEKTEIPDDPIVKKSDPAWTFLVNDLDTNAPTAGVTTKMPAKKSIPSKTESHLINVKTPATKNGNVTNEVIDITKNITDLKEPLPDENRAKSPDCNSCCERKPAGTTVYINVLDNLSGYKYVVNGVPSVGQDPKTYLVWEKLSRMNAKDIGSLVESVVSDPSSLKSIAERLKARKNEPENTRTARRKRSRINKRQFQWRTMDVYTSAYLLGSSNFVKALKALRLIRYTVRGRPRRPLVIFAPTDKAYYNGLTSLYSMNLNDMKERLAYHITVQDSHSASNFQSLGREYVLRTYRNVATKDAKASLQVENAVVVGDPIPTANGMIYLIDRILSPPSNTLVEIISNHPSLTTFTKILQMSGLIKVMKSGALPQVDEVCLDTDLCFKPKQDMAKQLQDAINQRQFTIYAPTDSVLTQISKEEMSSMLNNPELLRSIVGSHITYGATFRASVNSKTRSLAPTLTKDHVLFVTSADKKDNLLYSDFFGNRKYVSNYADIRAKDGVLHLINGLVSP